MHYRRGHGGAGHQHQGHPKQGQWQHDGQGHVPHRPSGRVNRQRRHSQEYRERWEQDLAGYHHPQQLAQWGQGPYYEDPAWRDRYGGPHTYSQEWGGQQEYDSGHIYPLQQEQHGFEPHCWGPEQQDPHHHQQGRGGHETGSYGGSQEQHEQHQLYGGSVGPIRPNTRWQACSIPTASEVGAAPNGNRVQLGSVSTVTGWEGGSSAAVTLPPGTWGNPPAERRPLPKHLEGRLQFDDGPAEQHGGAKQPTGGGQQAEQQAGPEQVAGGEQPAQRQAGPGPVVGGGAAAEQQAESAVPAKPLIEARQKHGARQRGRWKLRKKQQQSGSVLTRGGGPDSAAAGASSQGQQQRRRSVHERLSDPGWAAGADGHATVPPSASAAVRSVSQQVSSVLTSIAIPARPERELKKRQRENSQVHLMLKMEKEELAGLDMAAELLEVRAAKARKQQELLARMAGEQLQ